MRSYVYIQRAHKGTWCGHNLVGGGGGLYDEEPVWNCSCCCCCCCSPVLYSHRCLHPLYYSFLLHLLTVVRAFYHMHFLSRVLSVACATCHTSFLSYALPVTRASCHTRLLPHVFLCFVAAAPCPWLPLLSASCCTHPVTTCRFALASRRAHPSPLAPSAAVAQLRAPQVSLRLPKAPPCFTDVIMLKDASVGWRSPDPQASTEGNGGGAQAEAKPLLTHLDLTIKKKQRVLVLGPNGACACRPRAPSLCARVCMRVCVCMCSHKRMAARAGCQCMCRSVHGWRHAPFWGPPGDLVCWEAGTEELTRVWRERGQSSPLSCCCAAAGA